MTNQMDLEADTIGTLTPSQAARRERVLRTSLDLGAKGGYDAVQMREVATEAGVGNATLYRHFPTRRDLVQAVFADQMARYADAVQRASADPDPWQAVRELTCAHERLAVRRGDRP